FRFAHQLRPTMPVLEASGPGRRMVMDDLPALREATPDQREHAPGALLGIGELQFPSAGHDGAIGLELLEGEIGKEETSHFLLRRVRLAIAPRTGGEAAVHLVPTGE